MATKALFLLFLLVGVSFWTSPVTATGRSLLVASPLPTVVPPNCNPTGSLIVCGPGTTRTRCPATACSNSFSSAASGPNGCATSISQISAITFSSSYWSPLQTNLKSTVLSMCSQSANGVFNGQPAYQTFVPAIANFLGQATAATLIQYAQYACICSSGGSASTQISANVQATAQAVVRAYAEAIQQINGDVGNGCAPAFEDFLSFSNASATAVATTIVQATDSFFATLGGTAASSCLSTTGNTVQNRFSTAVASAVVCTIAAAYGLVYTDPAYPAITAGACSKSASYTGLGAAGGTAVCDLTPVCPCQNNPTNLIQNPGFEGGLAPWTVTGNPTYSRVIAFNAFSGSNSLRMGEAGQDGTLSQVIAGLNPADDAIYQLSFWMAMDGGPPNDGSLTLLKDDGSPITAINSYGPYPGTGPALPFVNVAPFPYNRYVFTFTPGTSSITIQIRVSARQDPGFLFLDEFSLMCSQYA